MSWTNEPPAAPGYYWMSEEPGISCIVEFTSANSFILFVGTERGEMLNELSPSTRWCGPIDPPSE